MQTFIIFAILFILAALGSGCQRATSAPNNSAAANTAPKPEQPKPAEPKPVEPAAPADNTTIGSLATPTEAYKTAYELRKKKDVAGLKKIMSNDIKEFLTMMGEAENKSLDDMIREMTEKPQADRAEVRNEKIKGNRAQLEYLTETGGWKIMDFEKIDSKWLLSFPKPDKLDYQDAER